MPISASQGLTIFQLQFFFLKKHYSENMRIRNVNETPTNNGIKGYIRQFSKGTLRAQNLYLNNQTISAAPVKNACP